MESFQVFQIKKLVILSKSLVFQIKNFEILGFLYIEFEILGISSEMSIISKTQFFNYGRSCFFLYVLTVTKRRYFAENTQYFKFNVPVQTYLVFYLNYQVFNLKFLVFQKYVKILFQTFLPKTSIFLFSFVMNVLHCSRYLKMLVDFHFKINNSTRENSCFLCWFCF